MAILTDVARAELEGLADAYGLPRLEHARGVEAGTVNTSYALTFGGRRLFLRIYEQQGHEGAEDEAALLVHLASAAVPTPAPLAGVDGLSVRTVAGKPAALFPWVDGDMLCQRAVTPAAGRDVGRALARIHAAGAPEGSRIGEGRFGPAALVARCADVAASKDAEARALAEPLRAAVLEAARARDPDLPRGLVHGDLFRDNVLWNERRIAALLDFESAFLGSFAFDLAVTILSWCYDDALRLDLARAIVDGYRSARELTRAERAGLFAEMRFAALRFTVTRIADDAARIGKRWQRFVARREAIEQLGPRALEEALFS